MRGDQELDGKITLSLLVGQQTLALDCKGRGQIKMSALWPHRSQFLSGCVILTERRSCVQRDSLALAPSLVL